MNIRCRKLNCTFNQNATCHAPTVAVTKGATCATYTPDKDKAALELAAELAPSVPHNVPLSCRAGACLYNHDCRCYANGIAVINDDQNKADCATFIER